MEVAKAPVPIERLAARLRSLRPTVLGGGAGRASHRYDRLLGLAASMLEVPLPQDWGAGADAKARARLEAALADAGLEVRVEAA